MTRVGLSLRNRLAWTTEFPRRPQARLPEGRTPPTPGTDVVAEWNAVTHLGTQGHVREAGQGNDPAGGAVRMHSDPGGRTAQ
jgi:hypothetical protein